MTVFDPLAVRANFPLFAMQATPLHYLDNGATAQMHAAALAAVREHDLTARGNVMRGNHRLAESASMAYESARRSVARFVGTADAEEIVFTSGATAAINLVAASCGYGLQAGDEVVVSQAEHHSNLLPWQRLCECGVVLRVLPLLADGRIDTSQLAETISPHCKLLAITHASNVTGAITDVAAVVAAAKRVGALVLLDGAQMAQHGPVEVTKLGCDFYVFSGHKCFGPTGIGVLWGRKDVLDALPPFMTGGGMVGRVGLQTSGWTDVPRRFEAGTPPITQAVGLAAVLDVLCTLDWAAIRMHETRLLQRLLDGVRDLPGLRVLGPLDTAQRLPVLSFTVDDMHPHDICQILDSHGVALRGGHHCAQPLMDFFGVDAATRASFALYNDSADVDAFLVGLRDAYEVLA